MAEINSRTSLTTISIGSGADADVVFLFANDICGEQDRVPRHARKYGDLAALAAEMQRQRIAALTDFRADVASASYPDVSETISVDDAELATFIDRIGQ